MRRLLPLILVAIGLIALPACASAKGGGGQVDGFALQTCVQERQEIGHRAFARKYGQHRPMRACIRRVRPDVQQALPEAQSNCQSDLQDLGLDDFIDLYGDDATTPLPAAMAECLSEGVDEIINGDDGDDSEDD